MVAEALVAEALVAEVLVAEALVAEVLVAEALVAEAFTDPAGPMCNNSMKIKTHGHNGLIKTIDDRELWRRCVRATCSTCDYDDFGNYLTIHTLKRVACKDQPL